MTRKGRYKYICDECQAVNWLTVKDRTSRFKPHCIECGSTQLSPSHASKGPDKLAEWHQQKTGRDEMQDEKKGIVPKHSYDYEIDDGV